MSPAVSSAGAWFRQPAWGEAERARFAAGLDTLRTHFDRAEAALTQGWTLLGHGGEAGASGASGAGGAAEAGGALELAWRVEREFRSDIHQARACWLEGCALAVLGRTDEALEALRGAFAAQREFGGVLTNAHLDFATLVLDCGLAALHDEVLALLDEFGGDDVTQPSTAFAHHRARALIALTRGDGEVARRQAYGALLVFAQGGRPARFAGEPGLFATVRPEAVAALEQVAGPGGR